jgi:hypothetical protein
VQDRLDHKQAAKRLGSLCSTNVMEGNLALCHTHALEAAAQQEPLKLLKSVEIATVEALRRIHVTVMLIVLVKCATTIMQAQKLMFAPT